MVIVGAGGAGVMAALAAREAGVEVCIVARAQGASAVSSGAIDLAADPSVTPRSFLRQETSLEKNLARILEQEPWHPLHSVAAEREGCAAKAGHVLRVFAITASLLREKGGLSLGGDGRENLARITGPGTLKFTALAPAAAGGFRTGEIGKVKPLFIGFAGLPGFSLPERQGRLFDELRGASSQNASRSELIELAEALGPNSNAIGLASLFDEEDYTRTVAKKISGAVGRNPGVDLVVLPPVLGLQQSEHCAKIFDEALGVPFVETLAVPPSAPGVRLQLALERLIEASGITMIPAEVLATEEKSSRLSEITIRRPRQEAESLRFGTLVLTTGKFVGGGLSKEARIREPLFDLPIFWRNERFESTVNEELFDRRLLAPQPAFAAGVRVDARMRPTDDLGEPIRENLFAAGAVLGGYDAVAGPGGLGVALVSGYCAGQNASS